MRKTDQEGVEGGHSQGRPPKKERLSRTLKGSGGHTGIRGESIPGSERSKWKCPGVSEKEQWHPCDWRRVSKGRASLVEIGPLSKT